MSAITPLRAAGLARRFRCSAQTARLAGDYTRAAALYRMAGACQDRALGCDFS